MWEGGKEDTREEGRERGERGGREEGREEGREGGERGGGKEGGERKGKGGSTHSFKQVEEEKRQIEGRKEGEEGTSHKLSQVSNLYCLQQVLWPRGEVRDNCTQVVMATCSLSTEQEVLLSWEGVREGGGESMGKDMKVSGYEGYEGVCNSIWVYERGREMTRRRVCVKSCSHVYTTISCVCVRL